MAVNLWFWIYYFKMKFKAVLTDAAGLKEFHSKWIPKFTRKIRGKIMNCSHSPSRSDRNNFKAGKRGSILFGEKWHPHIELPRRWVRCAIMLDHDWPRFLCAIRYDWRRRSKQEYFTCHRTELVAWMRNSLENNFQLSFIITEKLAAALIKLREENVICVKLKLTKNQFPCLSVVIETVSRIDMMWTQGVVEFINTLSEF